MKLLLAAGSLTLAMVCAVLWGRSADAAEPVASVFAHDVYFTLRDATPEGRQALVAACRTYLSGHEGTVFFAVGTRATDKTRDVNDTDFDVSLHIYFRDEAAHDAYQEHPRHKEFIEKMGHDWKTVRVFDSLVATVP